MTLRGTALIPAAALAVLLAGCGSEPAASNPEPAPPATQEEVIETPPELAFGATHTYADGVTITVSPPVRYERTEADLAQAIQEGGPQSGTRVTVKVVNGSKAPMDPSLIVGSATLDGTPVETLTFAPAPEGELRSAGYTLLPGQSQEFDQLYQVTGPGDLVLSYDHIETSKTDTEMGQIGTAYFRGNVTP